MYVVQIPESWVHSWGLPWKASSHKGARSKPIPLPCDHFEVQILYSPGKDDCIIQRDVEPMTLWWWACCNLSDIQVQIHATSEQSLKARKEAPDWAAAAGRPAGRQLSYWKPHAEVFLRSSLGLYSRPSTSL